MTAYTIDGAIRSRSLFASLACAVLLSAAPVARAAPLTLYAAGSLTTALTMVANDFTAATGMQVTRPAGSVRTAWTGRRCPTSSQAVAGSRR